MSTEWIIQIFLLGPMGSDVVKSFNYLAAGGFLFSGLLFVSSSAFNNMGRPIYSTIMTWSRDGLIMVPAVIIGASMFGATGVVYGNAVSALIIGLPSCLFGWLFIRNLNR
jgi:Na+-driven multidrug efflux pump